MKVEEQDKCALCGCGNNDLRTDHLRECFKISQDKLDASMYKPQLFYDEMGKLQRGFNTICNNRKKCRDRQRDIYAVYNK